jgi:multidrug resistance efflux pump
MARVRPIPTPLSQHWRRIRYQFMPVLVFLGASALSVWLWGQQAGITSAVGEAEVFRIDLTAPANGTLVALTRQWQTFEKVSKDQVIARMDDGECLAALAVIRRQVEQIRGELLATEAKTRMDLDAAARTIADTQQQNVLDLRRLAMDIEQYRLALLDRQILIDQDRIALQRATETLADTEKLVAKGVESDYALRDLRTNRDLLKQSMDDRVKGHAQAQDMFQAAQVRQEELRKALARTASTTQPSDVEVFLAPVRTAIAVEEARERELQLRLACLTVRSPIDGMIRDIFCFPGQTVSLGTPIMTIVGNEPPHVITYLREYHRVGPTVGAKVDMRVRTLPVRTVEGFVSEIGPQVVRVPIQHLRDPTKPEWGLPVRVDMAPESGIHPGELVDVTFRRSSREREP